jgi:hypothetical protein
MGKKTRTEKWLQYNLYEMTEGTVEEWGGNFFNLKDKQP